jgi:predicted dehydrogenase
MGSGRQSRTHRSRLAIVGGGRDWEERYATAFERLSERLSLVTVYGTVASQTEIFAERWRCEPAKSLRGAISRDDVDGVLILETDWQSTFPIELAACVGKPCLVGSPTLMTPADLPRLAARIGDLSGFVMVALERRHEPVTVRLKELVATVLGAPVEIDIALRGPDQARSDRAGLALLEAVDWCRYVAGGLSTRFTSSMSRDSRGLRIDLRFESTTSIVTARVRYRFDSAMEQPVFEGFQARTQFGSASYSSGDTLRWELQGDVRAESVTGERTAAEFLLDLFARRLVGGVVPMPGPGDLAVAMHACRQVFLSPSDG